MPSTLTSDDGLWRRGCLADWLQVMIRPAFSFSRAPEPVVMGRRRSRRRTSLSYRHPVRLVRSIRRTLSATFTVGGRTDLRSCALIGRVAVHALVRNLPLELLMLAVALAWCARVVRMFRT